VKKPEVRQMLYDGLGEVLGPAGFRLRKSEEAFVRPINGGLNRLSVALWDYQPLFEFSLVAGIRIDAVEELFHLCSGSPTAHQKLSSTTLTQLSYFTQPGDTKVSTPGEITAAIGALSPVVTGKILPFFEKYREIESLDRALNGGQDPKLDSTQQPSRALHWVSIAYLAGNPRFDQIAAGFAAEVQAFPEPWRSSLDCLLAKIKARQGS
jgi:hypothetical protein